MTNYTKLFNFWENSEFFPKNKVLLLDLSLCLVILKSNLNKKSGRSYVNLRYDFQLQNLKLKSLGRGVLVIFTLISAFGGKKVVLFVEISLCFLHQKKGIT